MLFLLVLPQVGLFLLFCVHTGARARACVWYACVVFIVMCLDVCGCERACDIHVCWAFIDELFEVQD